MAGKSKAKNAMLTPPLVPDDRRCIKRSGSGWRCHSEAQPGHRYCSYHLAYNRYKSLSRSVRTTENHGAGESLLRNKKRNRGSGNEATDQKVKPVNNDAMLSPIADDGIASENHGAGESLLRNKKSYRGSGNEATDQKVKPVNNDAMLSPIADDGIASENHGAGESLLRNKKSYRGAGNEATDQKVKPVNNDAMLSPIADDGIASENHGAGESLLRNKKSYRGAGNEDTDQKVKPVNNDAMLSPIADDGIASENHGAGESLLRNKKSYRGAGNEATDQKVKPVNNDAMQSPVADDLRCRWNAGSGWRCPSESQPGFAYCSYHLLYCGKCSRSHPTSRPKAVHTATRSKVTFTTADGMASEDHGTREQSPGNEEKRHKVTNVSSPLVMTALRGLAKKNRDKGIDKTNLNPKGILLGLTKRMSLIDPVYILKETKVMVEIRICKEEGKSSEAYKFCGQTEDEAALAAMEFLQCVLLEISKIHVAGMEKCHGGFEEIMTESAERTTDGKELDREEVLLVKCKYLIDSALEDLEARHRTI